MRSWKQAIARVPVIGPISRRAYRRIRKIQGRDTASTRSSRRDDSNLLPFLNEPLKGTQFLDGYASSAYPNFAKTFEEALYQVAQRLPIILFPPERGNEVRIGLNADHIDDFTKELGDALGTPLRWSGQPSLTYPAVLQDILSSKRRLKMVFRTDQDFRFTLEASAYSEHEGKLESRDGRNRALRHVHGASQHFLEEPGLHTTEEILGGREAHRHGFPVDVVYTWVNHEDPDWQKLYRTAKGHLTPSITPVHDDNDSDAESLARFKSRNELLYSIRSIERFLPWIRRIYVFSNCKAPPWLTPSDRIVWVSHESVMAPEHLPTFNSHAIESYLHKIPDLAEHFLYFNDDFFANESIYMDRFFASNGMPNANLEDYGVVNGRPMVDDKDYLNAARNGAVMLEREYGVFPTRLHKHTPYALRRSILEEIEEKFPDEMRRTRAASFRSMSDVSFVSFFFHHYIHATGRGTQVGYRSSLIKNSNPDVARTLAKLVPDNGIRTFCINDGDDSHLDETWNALIPEFLERRFPVPLADERLERVGPETEATVRSFSGWTSQAAPAAERTPQPKVVS